MYDDRPNLIPFSQFGPDRSAFDPSYTDTVVNALPLENSFEPFLSFVPFTEALPARPQGAFLAVNGNGVWLPIAGTVNALYRLDFATLDWVDISGPEAPYSTPVDTRWSFAQFGNLIIASNGVDQPQVHDITDVAGTFKTLPNAPRARNVSTLGDFLFFSYLPDMSDLAVQWSGLNDPEWWTPKQRSSDFQIFPDDGEIMSVSSFEKGVVIFHEHCIREGSLALDSPLIMNFQKTIENHGTHARNSVISTGAGAFYLSQDGFYKYTTPTPTKIGVERVDRFFFEDCDPDETFFIWGSEDPERKILYWSYRSKASTAVQTFDRILVYNYGVDRWSIIKLNFNMTQMVDGVAPGYTLDGLDSVGNLDDLPFSLDSRAWSGSLPVTAAFDDQFRLGFFSGKPMEVTIQTNDIQLSAAKRTFVNGFSPLGDSPVSIGRVGVRDFAGDVRTWLPASPANQFTGVIPARASGKFHRFEVTIPQGIDWKRIHGVEVNMQDEGKR